MLTFATTFDRLGSMHSVSVCTVMRGGFRPCPRRAIVGACVLLFALTPLASAQTPNVAVQPSADDEIDAVEQEVLDNILQQPVGDTTLESLDLPLPFLRRVAGRIIRSSYQHRYHVVVEDTHSASAGDDGSPNSANGLAPPGGPATDMNREQSSLNSSKPSRYDEPSLARTWLYLLGSGIVIGTTVGVVILRRGRRAR